MDINKVLETNESRVNFMKGLIALAKIDGVVYKNEQGFFVGAMNSLSIGEKDIIKLSDELVSPNIDKEISFNNKKQSLFFLKEAIQLCYCDNNYSEKEKDLIKEFAEKLNVSEKTLKSIEDWALEGYIWSKKGEQLLEREE